MSQIKKSRFFLLYLLNDRRIRIREAQKHVDPVDPDPARTLIFTFVKTTVVAGAAAAGSARAGWGG
jgi:hypothetical protein